MNGKAIEHMSEEHLREEIYKQGSDPGPCNYPNADEPYFNASVGRRSWNTKDPVWLLHTSKAKGRELVNFANIFVPLKDSKGLPAKPGPGTYNISEEIGKHTVSCPIAPIPQLAIHSTKFVSPVGPGSYDIGNAYDATTRMNKVAKAYLHADMRRKPKTAKYNRKKL